MGIFFSVLLKVSLFSQSNKKKEITQQSDYINYTLLPVPPSKKI